MALTARLLALLVALVVLAGQSAPVSASERPPAERRTGPLVVRYVGDDEAELAWYAAAVEQAYQEVQDVFGIALREAGTSPRGEVVVTLYGDDAAYGAANPVAARAEGVLGHASPSQGQVGIAVARLRDKSEGFRRDAVRHELTHVVLGDLSDQRLPIGLHEGIAQYVERDLSQRRRFADVLRRGRDAGQLLSLVDLNRQRPFLGRVELAYPQSYSVVVFLAERYGFGAVLGLVAATRTAGTLDEAVGQVFGRSVAELEAEWQAFLPGFLEQGWARNDLDLWDLAEPRRLLGEGQYADARDAFERAARLFASVGRPDREEQARAGQRQAAAGVEAAELSHAGVAALAAYEYDRAADLLKQAEHRWQEAGDDRRSSLAGAGALQAQDGQTAVARLVEARQELEGWRFQQADDLAYEAGVVLAELGDAARTEEARQVMTEARQLRVRLGMVAAGGGALGVGALGVVWLVGRRRRPEATPVRPGVAAAGRDWSL